MGNLITPKRVQKLQMALHAKAKAEAGYRLYALYDKISRADQQSDRAEFGIAAKDRAHEFGLAVNDDELAVLRPIPQWRHPAHPHPLPL